MYLELRAVLKVSASYMRLIHTVPSLFVGHLSVCGAHCSVLHSLTSSCIDNIYSSSPLLRFKLCRHCSSRDNGKRAVFGIPYQCRIRSRGLPIVPFVLLASNRVRVLPAVAARDISQRVPTTHARSLVRLHWTGRERVRQSNARASVSKWMDQTRSRLQRRCSPFALAASGADAAGETLN